MSEKRPSTLLQLTWGALSVGALGATWSNNIMFGLENPNANMIDFVQGAFANHAAASLSWDLVFLTAAVMVWMIHESRKHGMKGLWAYILLSFVVAIAVTTPIFMLMRERKIAQAHGTDVTEMS